MLCQVLTKTVDRYDADCVELRVDSFEAIDFEAIRKTIAAKTVIVTVRKKSHGGKFAGSEKERLALIETLAKISPHFLDIEYDTDPAFIAHIAKNYPDVKIILSLHNFEETPAALEIHESPYAYAYKIATFANSSVDALRMLLLIKSESKTKRITGICMGEKGMLTRIAGKICGNFIDYACADIVHATPPGQLTVRELIDIYRYHKLSGSTKLYALLGDPINKSVGHFAHNKVMQELGIDAVYIKIPVTTEELKPFLQLAKGIFSGFSITMPLKEAIIPYLDEVHTSMGAVNTVRIDDNRFLGCNTDGAGALDAIEKRASVRNKIVAIVGAGGAAKAIAFEARRRGAHIAILNRNMEKAEELAMLVDGSVSVSKYDVLINCTPEPLAITPLEDAIVMDIDIVPRQIKGKTIIHGHEMFINQAALQWQYWSNQKISPSSVREIIAAETVKNLAT